MTFQPQIVAFLCNWCSYEGADSAGKAQREYPANVRIVKVMCSGRVDPQFVLKALKEGADGVMILGCHPGDCHYKEGNYSASKRFGILKDILKDFGLADRVSLDWVSASEGEKFARITSEFVEEIRQLGPIS